MKLLLSAILILAILCRAALARPQYKDIDYKLFGENDDGVAIDAVYEMITEKPPDGKHHHHTHHKKMAKSNRLERLRRYLDGYDQL
uniref:Secreted protein n=1 Tax=Caenorhabditis tropicalis TaxID=1561998 RepID=A0A1I7UD65_9PELO